MEKNILPLNIPDTIRETLIIDAENMNGFSRIGWKLLAVIQNERIDYDSEVGWVKVKRHYFTVMETKYIFGRLENVEEPSSSERKRWNHANYIKRLLKG